MDIIKINASCVYNELIYIGRQNENDVMEVEFDLKDWISSFGQGSATLTVQRNRDVNPYIVPLTISPDGIAVWTISTLDTEQRGGGKIQLTYYVDSKVKKSVIYMFNVRESIRSDGPAPEPYESWLEVLQELTAETTANAQSASQSAQSAGQSASDAEQSMQEAQGYADDASTSAQSASVDAGRAEAARDTAQTYANNAQNSATSAQISVSQASASAGTASASAGTASAAATSASASAASAYADAERAEQAAATSGYLWFYIEDGKLYMDRTANTQVDFFMRDGKLYVEERA